MSIFDQLHTEIYSEWRPIKNLKFNYNYKPTGMKFDTHIGLTNITRIRWLIWSAILFDNRNNLKTWNSNKTEVNKAISVSKCTELTYQDLEWIHQMDWYTIHWLSCLKMATDYKELLSGRTNFRGLSRFFTRGPIFVKLLLFLWNLLLFCEIYC